MNININAQTTRRHSSETHYRQQATIISSSLDSEYIPFFALFMGEYKRIGDFRYINYFLPIYSYNYRSERTTRNMELFLNNTVCPISIIKGGHTYRVMKHCIFSITDTSFTTPTYDIFSMLVIEKEYAYNIDFNNLDYSKFKLLVDNKFATPIYKLMYTFFNKEILPGYVALGIDLIFTSDIKRYCFKDFTRSQQFTTIADRRIFFNQLNRRTLDAYNTRG